MSIYFNGCVYLICNLDSNKSIEELVKLLFENGIMLSPETVDKMDLLMCAIGIGKFWENENDE